jgi:hypothetical protein
MLKSLIKKGLKSVGYEAVPQHTLVLNTRQIRNVLYFGRMFDHIRNVGGNIVECGVGRGRSFLYLSYLIEEESKGRKIFGFDSFEGFPEPHAADMNFRAPKKGEWSGVSPHDITSLLKVAGITAPFIANKVHLVPGFFTTSLSKYTGEPIALLHVDVDLYESYKDVLEALYKHIVPGGIVLFDEYNTPEWPGATKAIDEFFKDQKANIKLDSRSGKYYLIKS